MLGTGSQVFIADGNRPFTPKTGVEPVMTKRLRVNRDIEGCDTRDVRIYRMIE